LQLRLSDLRRLQRESPTSPFAFVSERWSPFTTAGFTWMIERAAPRLVLREHLCLPRFGWH
jgi:hypothetical protein